MVLIHPDSFRARSNIGSSWAETWNGLLEGKSRFVFPHSDFGLNGWPVGPPMGVIADWGPEGVPPFESRTVRLLTLLAEDAGAYLEEVILREPGARVFSFIASSHGDPGPVSRLVSEGDPRSLPPELRRRLLFDDLSGVVRRTLKRDIPISFVSAACASAMVATLLAWQKLEADAADIALVFALDTISLIAYSGFEKAGAMSKTGTRPFDAARDGMTASEGGVAFVLSREAFFHGDRPAVAIAGGGCNCDRGHMVEPSVKGILDVMEEGMQNTGLTPAEISFVYWHGTGTLLNDAAEAEAAKLFFGENIPPGCSTKGNLGHTMGASGGFNLMGASSSLLSQTLPPSGRLNNPGFPFLNISAQKQKVEGNAALCMSLGFGGINASLILRKSI